MVKRRFMQLDWTNKKLPHTTHSLGNGIQPMCRGLIEQSTTRVYAQSADTAKYNYMPSSIRCAIPLHKRHEADPGASKCGGHPQNLSIFFVEKIIDNHSKSPLPPHR
jgi:hypothetical protein